MATRHPTVSRPAPARDRILDTSYELFSRRGVRAVGVDEVIERAGVAKATLYRHFPSKDDLVVAFLERREERWTIGWVETEARRRGSGPEEQLLAIFDAFDEWFRREDFEACSFINVLLELGPQHAAGSASVAASREHPLDRARTRRGSGSPRAGLLRTLMAHPHEGVDHRGGRGRRRGGATSPDDGAAPDRRSPLTSPQPPDQGPERVEEHSRCLREAPKPICPRPASSRLGDSQCAEASRDRLERISVAESKTGSEASHLAVPGAEAPTLR